MTRMLLIQTPPVLAAWPQGDRNRTVPTKASFVHTGHPANTGVTSASQTFVWNLSEIRLVGRPLHQQWATADVEGEVPFCPELNK